MVNNTNYNKITAEIVAKLKLISGEKHVIFNDFERLEPFSHDEIPGKKYRNMPDVVVSPADASEISAIVKLANIEKIPITPRGAGSGLSGGAVPIHGGIVITTDRMNKILEVDLKNMMIVVEPGVISNDINEHVKQFILF